MQWSSVLDSSSQNGQRMELTFQASVRTLQSDQGQVRVGTQKRVGCSEAANNVGLICATYELKCTNHRLKLT